MASTRQSASVSDQGLLAFRRHVECATEVSLSFEEVERAARVCLGQLVPDSLSVAAAPRLKTVAPMRHGFRAPRVVVQPEVSSARTHNGAVGHVHWYARRFRRLFPVMEADLVARPLSGGCTQLVLEATYRPPGGLLGVVGDALFGRVVARSTAEAFTSHLAQAMEGAITDRRCGNWHSSISSNGAE